MVLSFVPMSTLDPMVVPRALVLLHLNPLMMLVMLFSNSTAMTGRVALLKFARIVSLALVLDSADEAALEAVEASEVDSADVEISAAVEDLEVALEVVEALVVVVVDMEVLLVVVSMPELQLDHPTHLPTMQLVALREARPSTFATYVSASLVSRGIY